MLDMLNIVFGEVLIIIYYLCIGISTFKYYGQDKPFCKSSIT